MDWLDPAQWKDPAELIDYWKTIVVGIVAILGAFGAVLKWGFAPFRWIASQIKSRKKPPAERPLRFVLDEHQSIWSRAKSGDRQGTNVFGHWHVTNVSGRDVVLLRARLENYNAETSHVATKGTPDAQLMVPTFDHKNPIPAGEMSQVIAHFSFYPPICDSREPLVVDVIFTDNYEEEYRLRSVRFPYRGK
jgi:hypothetical protein